MGSSGVGMVNFRWWSLGAVAAFLMFVSVGCAPAAPEPSAPAAPPAPAAPTPDPFSYEGKTIRFIVGSAPGGSHDIWQRLIARHIGKHIPGNPSTIVENIPGAGGLIAANHLYKVAKPDGLTVGQFPAGNVLNQLMGGEGIEFDARKFNWIGAPTSSTVACYVRAERGIKTAQDFLYSPTQVKIGALAVGTQHEDIPRLLNAGLGATLKIVSGYAGAAPVYLAMERGEVDGACSSWEGVKAGQKDAVERGLIVPLLFIDQRHRDFLGLPLAVELAKTEEARQLLRARNIPDVGMFSALTAPPDVPSGRVATLRKAYLAALKDPELVAEAQKLNLELVPKSGEEVQKVVEELFRTPPEVVKKLAEILK